MATVEKASQSGPRLARLATAFEITGTYRLVSRVGRVNYVDFESCDLGANGNDLAHVAFIKDKAYAEENEVRVMTVNSLHPGCLTQDGGPAGDTFGGVFLPNIKGFFIKCDLRQLIRSVVVGPNAAQSFRMLMKRLTSRYGLTVDVEYSELPRLG